MLSIPRSFSLLSPNQAVTLHVFVDASWIAYGSVAYFVHEENKHVVLVSSRSRVSPEETDVDAGGSTPRPELQAAVTGIELSTQIQEEWPPLPAREATVGALYLEENSQESTVDSESFVSLICRKSNFNSAEHILAYVLRFISDCRGGEGR